MKVLWICHFSNPQIREKLNLSVNPFEIVIRKLLNKNPFQWYDYAAWITNGIREFENIDDIEFHVVSPHYGLIKKNKNFQLNNINYHFFKPDDDSLFIKTKRYITKSYESDYSRNRITIKKLVSTINPDIIHMYGAENPYYSISALDVDRNKYPFLVSLQTLMSETEFKLKHTTSAEIYDYRAKIEQDILKKSTYIGSTVQKYRDYIWQNINPKAIFFKTYLAVAEKIPVFNYEKKYDFVYFAASISKAADVAIEAFAIACKKYPKITLNIIGSTTLKFKHVLQLRIKELGIENNVYFSGQLPTHDDVIKQIQFSRFALLPLKIDVISGTIREAMFSGIPVISTITSGTPTLNTKRESVLLSVQGDYNSMAQNMIKLIESPDLAKKLAENGLITVNERWNNSESMRQLIDAYHVIIDHHQKSISIPIEIGAVNPNK